MEPSLDGLNGLLCFPCRFKFDEEGGEAFHDERAKFEIDFATWESKYGTRWVRREHYRMLSDKCSLPASFAIFLLLFGLVIMQWSGAVFFGTVGGLIAFSFVSAGITGRLLRKYNCPAPPKPPSKDDYALFARPTLTLDDPTCGGLDPSLVNFSNGYPPDWAARQAKCIERDDHKCRLCGATETLHVHHVKPISFGGPHSLQNLITLCRKCHMKQGYYEHRELVRHNIRAKKKYWVHGYTREDGVKVKGHHRRIGRRGNFWKEINEARDNDRSD